MKLFALLVGLVLLTEAAMAQDPILAANKCYNDKNYECASGKYKEALAEKKYQEKDLSLIKYRIGYSLSSLNQHSQAIPYLEEALVTKPDYGDAVWGLAWAHYSIADYTKAADYYAKAMPFYKNDTTNLKTLHYWQGKSYMGAQKYKEAVAAIREAIRIDSTNEDFHASLGDALYNQASYTDAISAYRKSIAVSKKEKVSTSYRYYWIGSAFTSLSKPEEAMVEYRKALEYNPDNKKAVWGVGSAYYNQKKYKEAAEQYSKTIALYKGDSLSLADLYLYRGDAYLMLKEYERSLADYDIALRYDPLMVTVWGQKANVMKNQKKYKDAIKLYDKAVSEMDEVLDKGRLDDLHFFRGLCYFQLKDTLNAEKDFKASLNYNSKLADPNLYMGHVCFSRKEYTSAKNYYAIALGAYKSDSAEMSVIYYRKGFSNYILGDSYFYTAKEDFLKSISLDSTNVWAHRSLGDCYYRQNYFVLAEKEFNSCINLSKKEKDSLPSLYLYRGVSRWQQKKYKEAFEDYEQSDKLLAFKNAENIKNMGQLAFEVKEYEKASKIFSRLVPMYKPEQKAELLFVYFARGRAALELKKKELAVKDLKKALEYDPGNKEVSTWLSKAEAL